MTLPSPLKYSVIIMQINYHRHILMTIAIDLETGFYENVTSVGIVKYFSLHLQFGTF